jgi:hypothetical protein
LVEIINEPSNILINNEISVEASHPEQVIELVSSSPPVIISEVVNVNNVEEREKYEKNKQELFDDQMDEIIDKFKEVEVKSSEYDCILLKEPEDVDGFLAAMEEDRNKHSNHLNISNQITFTNYWDNVITSIGSIMNRLNEVFEMERNSNNTIIKCSTTYGIVVETANKGVEDTYTYTIFNPNDSNNAHHHTVNLNDMDSINKYKDLIRAEINEMSEMGDLQIDSTTHYICIHKIQINCYYMTDVGSGKGEFALINKLCLKDDAFSYTGKYEICWFAIPVLYEYYSNNTTRKHMNHHKLEFETIKKWQSYYGVEGTAFQPVVRDKLSQYSGFNAGGEIVRFIEFFKLPSIQVFTYNDLLHRYQSGFVYKCKDHEEAGEDYTGNFVRIALVKVNKEKLHSGEKNTIPIFHVIYLKDLNFLNIRVCEKCQYCVFDMSRYGFEGNNIKYYDHIKKCTGKRPEKRLRVSKLELPICPGMLYNNTWLFLKGHNKMDQWKPDQYFGVFDLETVETPLEPVQLEEMTIENLDLSELEELVQLETAMEVKEEENSDILNVKRDVLESSEKEKEDVMKSYLKKRKSKKTKILSTLNTIAVASAYKTKSGIIETYHDIREGPDFLRMWMMEVVKYSKIIYKDNLYDDEEIPHKREAVIFGYNSSKFDTNLLFKELHNPPDWNITTVIGDVCNFKEVIVEIPYEEEKELKHLDHDEIEEVDENIEIPIDDDEDETSEDENEQSIEEVPEVIEEALDGESEKKEKKRKPEVLQIKFLDAKNFSTPMPLADFVKTYTDEPVEENDMKGVFPYEYLHSYDFAEKLQRTRPFPQEAFDNSMKHTKMTDEEYSKFLNDWDYLKDEFRTNEICGWDYLQYYNRQDVRIMIKPITFLINVWARFNINMLSFMTLASCAQAVKYYFHYKGMDINKNYVIEDGVLPNFELSMEWLEMKCKGYKSQDERRDRTTEDNIKPDAVCYVQGDLQKQTDLL